MKKLLLILSFVVFVVVFGYMAIQRFANPDMTDIRFFYTFWPFYIILIISGIVFFNQIKD